jgi:multiple sugar transport system substrate-binding protein
VLDPNDPTKVIIDSTGTVNGLATWRETIESGVSPQAVLQYLEDESAASFLNGDSVFIRNWPYMYALPGTSDYPKLEPELLGIAPIPVDKPGNQSYSTLGGWNFLINATSESQDEAWEFIEWITAPEQLITNAELGSKLPTRETLYDDPAVLKKVPVAKLGKDAIIENSTPRPISPYYSDVSLELSEQFNACLAGNISPDKAASTLQANLQEIIDQGEQAAG